MLERDLVICSGKKDPLPPTCPRSVENTNTAMQSCLIAQQWGRVGWWLLCTDKAISSYSLPANTCGRMNVQDSYETHGCWKRFPRQRNLNKNLLVRVPLRIDRRSNILGIRHNATMWVFQAVQCRVPSGTFHLYKRFQTLKRSLLKAQAKEPFVVAGRTFISLCFQ